MNQKLLDLLRKLEWLERDTYEAAQNANKAAYNAKSVPPHTQQEIRQLEKNMLRAQIELEREEGESQPNKRGGNP